MEPNIENKTDQIANRMDQLTDRIGVLEDKIDKLIQVCSKMNSHIDFVETTYKSVRAPLTFFKNKLNYMIGSRDTTELPDINHPLNSTPKLEDNDNGNK